MAMETELMEKVQKKNIHLLLKIYKAEQKIWYFELYKKRLDRENIKPSTTTPTNTQMQKIVGEK